MHGSRKIVWITSSLICVAILAAGILHLTHTCQLFEKTGSEVGCTLCTLSFQILIPQVLTMVTLVLISRQQGVAILSSYTTRYFALPCSRPPPSNS